MQDLVRAIPENREEPLAQISELANRQEEEAQAVYQRWASLAKAVYRVESPQDIDQRIAFLMQSRQQSQNSITQVLAQSPAVQELQSRDRSYVQNYSEYCQSQAEVFDRKSQPILEKLSEQSPSVVLDLKLERGL